MSFFGSRPCKKCDAQKQIIEVTKINSLGLPLEYKLECGHKVKAL